MVSSGGDFERAFGHGLAADVAEVGIVGSSRCEIGNIRWRCGEARRLLQELNHLAQMPQSEYGNALCNGCFRGIFKRNQEIAYAALGRADGDGQRAAYRP